jgi:hypothetical protein
VARTKRVPHGHGQEDSQPPAHGDIFVKQGLPPEVPVGREEAVQILFVSSLIVIVVLPGGRKMAGQSDQSRQAEKGPSRKWPQTSSFAGSCNSPT